jgi:hypothetical protein
MVTRQQLYRCVSAPLLHLEAKECYLFSGREMDGHAETMEDGNKNVKRLEIAGKRRQMAAVGRVSKRTRETSDGATLLDLEIPYTGGCSFNF